MSRCSRAAPRCWAREQQFAVCPRKPLKHTHTKALSIRRRRQTIHPAASRLVRTWSQRDFMEIQWAKLGLQVDFLARQVKPLALRFADCQDVLLLERETVLFDQSREKILPDRVAVDRDNSVVVALWPVRSQHVVRTVHPHDCSALIEYGHENLEKRFLAAQRLLGNWYRLLYWRRSHRFFPHNAHRMSIHEQPQEQGNDIAYHHPTGGTHQGVHTSSIRDHQRRQSF